MPQVGECGIYEKACRKGICNHVKFQRKDTKMEIQTQTVWCTMSHSATGGYYVWNVMEFVPYEKVTKPEGKIAHLFVECGDGTFVSQQCYHFWSKETAEEFLNRKDTYQELIVIEKPKRTIKVGDRVRRLHHDFTGVVEAIRLCNSNCNKKEITIRMQSGVIGYWHVEDFELID